jgi:ATP synthase protein I
LIKNIQKSQRIAVYHFLKTEAGAALLISAVLGLIWGFILAYSVFVGALISILGNACLGAKLFADTGSFGGKVILVAFYRGVLIKIVLTIALFAIAIYYLDLTFIPFIVAFLIAQLSFNFAPWAWRHPGQFMKKSVER